MSARSRERARAMTGEQQEAVARRGGELLLSAGAGSGKTAVLVERFVAAVREDGIAASRILAITFTDRAAGELRARVRERLTQLSARDSARDSELAFVSTFHGFCVRLLRTRALLAGLDPDFEILDESLAARLRERAFDAALTGFLDGSPERLDLLAAYGPDELRQMLASAYAELRSRGERSPRIPQPGDVEQSQLAAAATVGLLDVLLAGFGDRYEGLKRDRGAVDFDDLELGARDLLRDHADVRAQWSERFDLLMVDEFQDTNARQLEILSALSRENLFTVGDELQAIYSFRHADVELFRARRAQLTPSGASLVLTRNFRGLPALLDVVNAAFAGRLREDGPLLAPARSAPRGGGEPSVELLLTARGGWEADERLAGEIAAGLPACPLWRQAEARALAARVAQLVDSGRARAGEIAVLLRAVSDMEVYEGALAQQGLSTLATVGSFWERQQVADLLAYLRALANPLDEPALLGVLASPLVGISTDALALLAEGARAGRCGLWEAIGGGGEALARLEPRDREALADFHARFAAERAGASRRPISTLIERALGQSGYREQLLELASARQRLANIHKLLRLAGRFEASEGRDLRGFLDYVQQREAGSDRSEPDAPVDDVEPDAVRLMSVHAAKGLEFAVVCVADLGRRPNLTVPDLLVDGELVGLRLARLEEGEREATLHYELLCERRRLAQAEEEDRILYVAMTRARERLLLSGAVDFARWPEQRVGAPPIGWLATALSAELPSRAAAGVSATFDLALDRGDSEVRVRLQAPPPQATLPGLEAAFDQGPRASTPAPAVAVGRPAGEPPGALGPGGLSARPAPAAAQASVDSLSYTTLTALERCGYRYYLERVLAMPERRAASRAQDGGGLSARARGTLAHRLLESVDFANPRPVSEQDVSRAAGELAIRVSGAERVEVAELVSALSGEAVLGEAATRTPGARVALAASVHREYPFAFSLAPEEPLLSGVIDLLAREADGGVLVLDYKTDRVSSKEDLEALVAREYGAQRLLYCLAVLRSGAPRVEIVHWFLHRPGDWVSARYERAQRRELEEQMRARIARAQRFDVSSHPRRALCETCPGRGTLCSYDEAATLAQ